jgi:predicted amidohydrolase
LTRIAHWDKLLQARAIENQCFMIGVNRVGDDKKLHYPGHSSVINPMGKVTAICLEEKIEIVEIDKSEVSSIREQLPFLDDIKLIK